VTGPPTCSTCQRQDLLWQRFDVVAGPGRGGECYWHSKLAAMANGGLPVAELEQRSGLDQLLGAFDRADERQALRLRGVRYTVTFGGMRVEVEA